jgi:hypothetical protein
LDAICPLEGVIAHIESVSTGFHVITHVRGRVYRDQGRPKKPEQTLQSRIKHAAKKRRRICLLSSRAAEALEQFHVSQPCFGNGCQHAHHTRARIALLIKSGDLRWVGNGENVAAWVDGRTWKGVPSQGYQTMQLVQG